MSSELSAQVEDLEANVTQLKQREQQLLMEIKKRGDLARQLCSSKDEEIRQLREKLHYDQKHNHPHTSPVNKAKKALQKSGSSNSIEDRGLATSTPLKEDGGICSVGEKDTSLTPQAVHSNAEAGNARSGESNAESNASTPVVMRSNAENEKNADGTDFVELELEDEEDEEVGADDGDTDT